MNGKVSIIGAMIIIVGGILGSFLASVTKGISFLAWLSYGGVFGIATNAPMVIDLGIIKLTFGLTININIAVVLGLILAVIIWRRIR